MPPLSILISRRLALAVSLTLGGILPAVAQQAVTTEVDIAQNYNAAMQAFAKGDWEGCSTGLEQVIKMMVNEKQQGALEGIYYTLGAAYFNMPNYPKAIEAFEKFTTKFGKSTKIWEVRLALAQAHRQNKGFDQAIKLYEALESVPLYREQALNAQVQIYQEQEKPLEAVRVLERIVGADIQTTVQATAAMSLAQLLANQNQPEKAVGWLQRLQMKTALIENLVALNALAVKLGDEFSEKKLYNQAIAAYRAVRSREEVLKFQTERIAAMDRRIDANLKAATGNPVLFAQMTQWNNQIKAAQAEAKSLLEEFIKLPDFAASVLFRMARCWYDSERKWEAIVVFDRILARHPKATERESALYGMIVAYAEVSQPKRAQELCEVYLKEFPSGENAQTVGYLSGAVALQAQDLQGAESYFGTMLEKQPESSFREEMRFLLGNAKFMQGKHDEAQKEYAAYLKEYPQGQNVEEVRYRTALADLFAGRFEVALTGLNGYLGQYPEGTMVADAKYRIAVCKYAAEQYDKVVADCRAWLQQFTSHEQEGEVQALLGDALAAQGELAEAVPAYRRSYQVATTDEVLNYSLFEASKHLQKLGKWPEISEMFEAFVKEKPDHASVVAAMFWIGKARAREGKIEEAKQFTVDTLKRFIGEPRREAVEQLLTQLAQLCAKRPRPTAPVLTPVQVSQTKEPVIASTAAPVPAAEPPAPEPPPFDPAAELEKRLAPLEEGANATAKARLMYARAELASLRKKPADRDRLIESIAGEFKPEDLSPLLLAQIGDLHLGKGDHERAATYYTRLKEDFPKSDYLDVAYVGLGEIAFAKKKYDDALPLFTDALEKIAASMKLKEATIGKAKTLLELGQYAESRKLFEQVASVREWRGDSTAYAVFSLGEIEARQGRSAEAIAHYRRVFVAYQKFLPWVAKAYLRAAESFEKMGKRKDAIENLQEMLRNERLAPFPEAEQARRLLAQWGAT